jgi:hypothetical protein
MSGREGKRSDAARWPVVFLVAGLAGSRVVYHALGVRFDDSPLQSYWQYLDPVLLREDLLSSVWHLHTQPPLYNLFLGGVLKLGGDSRDLFAAGYLALGFAGAFALFELMRRLDLPAAIAAVLSLIFFASPAAVLYENWLYAEYPVLVALLVAALCLHMFASGRGMRFAALAFGCAAFVVLTRTLFHPVWLLAVVALTFLLQPGRRREVLAASVVPLLVVGALQLNALVQFGNTSMTSCTGLNVFRVVTAQVPLPERRELASRGVLSPYAVPNPFTLPRTRPAAFRREPRHGVAVLDNPLKSNGHVNVGHAAYVDICGDLTADGVELARRHPDVLRRSVQRGFEIYWRPASQYALFSERNRDATHEVERAASILLGQVDRDPEPGDFSLWAQLDEIAWVLLLAYVLVFAIAVRALIRVLRRREPATADTLVAAFVAMTVLLVTTFGNVLESGENNRFHFALDPLVLAVVAANLGKWAARGGRARP